MTIRLLLFARLRELCGTDHVEVELRDGATVNDAFALLADRHPAVEPTRRRVMVAVNESYGAWEQSLADGDEVAFIPPVSGG